jgi:type IV secretory pathway TrbD component
MTNSDNRRWALFGPLAVVLWVVGIALLNNNGPADHATGNDILAWYRSHTNTILFGGWAFMLGCLSFVTFISGVRVRLAGAVGEGSQLPGLALAGAAIAGVAGMLTAAVDVAGAIDKSDIDPATAAAFHHSVDIFFVCAELGAILPIAAVAIVAWRTRVLPRWWAAFGGLVAIVLIIGPIGWLGLIFGVPLWTLGTSLFVLLRSPERMRSTAAATA